MVWYHRRGNLPVSALWPKTDEAMAEQGEPQTTPQELTVTDEITAYLTGRIESGQIAEGDKLPSRAELARQFNTSQTTVTYALRNLARQRRLRHVAGQGIFLASDSDDLRTFTIGLIGRYASQMAQDQPLFRVPSGYWTPIVNSILHACQERKLAVLVIPNTDREPVNLSRLQAFGTDVLISHGIMLNPQTVVELRRMGIPIVVGNRGDGALQRVGASTVDYDWAGGFRRAARIFHAKGHRRILAVCMRATDDGWRYWREQFLMEAVQLGLPDVSPEQFRVLIKPVETMARDEYALFLADQTAQALDGSAPPTAFYYNAGYRDLYAVHKVFAERNLALGRDVDAIALAVQGTEADTPISVFLERGDVLGAALVDAACKLAEDPYEVLQTDVSFNFQPHPESGLTEPVQKGG